MAERHTPQRQMSLIPYTNDENRDIVLRRGDAVVVYDPDSQSLSLRDAPREHFVNECPFCRRPYGREYDHNNSDSEDGQHAYAGVEEDRPFLDKNYFAMLAASTRPSPANTEPGTPTGRRFPPAALRSGRSRDVSGAAGPPSGAEFLASEPKTGGNQGISSNAFNPGYFKQHFIEQGILGRGGNGVVLLVEHMMDHVSLGRFACKRVPVGNDHAWLEKVLIEVNLLRQTSHPNLVPCHWVWLEDHQPTKFGPPVPCLWILQEFCRGGDLQSYVLGPKEQADPKEKLKERMRRRSRGDASPPDLRGPSKLTFEEIFSFFRDITSGLHHLHSLGYIHRDLKPSNCLLQNDGTKKRALISDFGEMQITGSKRGNTGATGTISYCAPEVLRHNESDGLFGDFTTKSDIFSLGMIVYFMCFGRLPYINADGVDEDNEDLDQLRAEITSWAGFSDEARMRPDLPEKLYKYLKRLLSVDPNQRPGTDEILLSIKAGAGISDMFSSSAVDDGPSRVSPIDSPRPTPSPRRPSAILSRPGLSSLRHRHSSSHDKQLTRSPSPKKRSGTYDSAESSHSRPRSADSAVVVRPKHIDMPSPYATSPTSPQQSPRLMLPPPPPPHTLTHAIVHRLHDALHHPAAEPSLRGALFLMKMILLFIPCAPFAATSWLLYPLLALAAVDLGILPFHWQRSWMLLGLHCVVVYVARQRGVLCEGKSVAWDVFG